MTQTSAAQPRRPRVGLWIETLVVFLACLVRPLFQSIAAVYLHADMKGYSFLYLATTTIVSSVADIAIVLFIIWQSKEPLARFGIRPFRVTADILGGVALLVITWIAYFLFFRSFYIVLGKTTYTELVKGHFVYHPFAFPSGAAEWALWTVTSAVNGLREELVVRAYLITRLEELFGSTAFAVFVSTAIFACYHGYEGAVGVIGVAIIGLIFGLAFARFRRLAPVALAHALQDIIVVAVRR